MAKITKRALWGYSPEAVERLLERMKAEHESACLGMRRRIDELEGEREALRARIERLRLEMEAPAPDADMAKRLLDAHFEATADVLTAKAQLNDSTMHRERLERYVVERQAALLSEVKAKLARVADAEPTRSFFIPDGEAETESH